MQHFSGNELVACIAVGTELASKDIRMLCASEPFCRAASAWDGYEGTLGKLLSAEYPVKDTFENSAMAFDTFLVRLREAGFPMPDVIQRCLNETPK